LTVLLLVGPPCVACLAITVAGSGWFGQALPSWATWPAALATVLAYLASVMLAPSPAWRPLTLAAFSLGVGALVGAWLPDPTGMEAAAGRATLALAGVLAAGCIGWRWPRVPLRLGRPFTVCFWIYLIGLPLASLSGEKGLLRLIAAAGWWVTFGLTASWAASISNGAAVVSGHHRLAAYMYVLNLYISSLIALGAD
jgi:hypothetical protein